MLRIRVIISLKLELFPFFIPPGTGDIHLSIAQTINIAGGLIVTTPQKLALADAQKAAKMFEAVNIPLLGLVENMSSFVCPRYVIKKTLELNLC